MSFITFLENFAACLLFEQDFYSRAESKDKENPVLNTFSIFLLDHTACIRIHTGENPFKYAECEKSFSDSIDIKKHKMIHTEEKPFKCTKCDKTFSDYTGLRKHKRIHTGEKPFKCTECDKSFSDYTDLKRDTRRSTVHIGEKQ